MSESRKQRFEDQEQALRAAILDIQDAADAESYGYGDTYYALVDFYHRAYDASWMPRGYRMATRDPSLPIVIDMSDIPELASEDGALFSFVSCLAKAHDAEVKWT